MDCLRTRFLSRSNDGLDAQITFNWRGASDVNRFVAGHDMFGRFVAVRINPNCPDAEPGRRGCNAATDFAAISD